jgi:nucleoside-diphosphate kinase
MIKPDAVERSLVGAILDRTEKAGFSVAAMKLVHMSKQEAEGFYIVHKDRPFYGELTDQMSAGPTVVLVLEGEDAQPAWRELMGATNPKDAAEGTIRKEFAIDLGNNSVHGSDSVENAAWEISYWFAETEIVNG